MHEAPPDTSLPVKHNDTVILALWFGLITAAAETALLLLKRHVRGQMIDAGPHFVWLLSAADVVMFVLLAGLVAGGAALTGRRLRVRTLVFVLGAWSAFSILLHYRPLAMYARLILAVGAASIAAGLAVRFWPHARRIARRTLPALVILITLTTLTQSTGPSVDSGGVSSDTAGMPNILLIILDTVAARDVSLYGYDRETTPNLERLAKQGVVFDHAFSTAPWTVPSHASMFTGRYPADLSADWTTALDATHPVVAEEFHAHGYATALIAANRFLGSEFGLDRGFSHRSASRLSPARALTLTAAGRWLNGRGNWVRRLTHYYRPIARRSAADINSHALQWIRDRDQQPFFAVLNYVDAHAPYVAPAPFDELFEVEQARTNPMLDPEWTADAIAAERAAYDEAIAHVDSHVGRLIAQLESDGTLDNTVVIITSDHGEQFGEHGHMEHSPSLYLGSLWVPLLVIAPGAPANQRVQANVSLRDLAATMLDLAGINSAEYPGESLARFWTGQPDLAHTVAAEVSRGIRTPPEYPFSRGDMTAVILGGYQYIMNGDGIEELYDFEHDPDESVNLSNDPRFAELLAELRTAAQRLKATGETKS